MKKLNETEGVKMEKALAEKTGGYLIGDVAQMVGLSRDALRFYEKKGIIRAGSEENGIIEYTNALVLPEFCKFYSDGVIQDSKLNVYAQSI